MMLMKKVLLICLISIILTNISLSQTNVSEGNLTLQEYNGTNSTLVNETVITKSDFERLHQLTEKLIEQQKLTLQEKEFLKAISERSTNNEKLFSDTLSTSTDLNKQLIVQLELERNDSNEFKQKADITFDKLKLQIFELQNDVYKTHVWQTVYIILSFILGIIVISIIMWLRRRNKLYFIIRWIRYKIPIKF